MRGLLPGPRSRSCRGGKPGVAWTQQVRTAAHMVCRCCNRDCLVSLRASHAAALCCQVLGRSWCPPRCCSLLSLHMQAKHVQLPPLCRPETGSWTSAFAYCRGKCRTSSRSTVHENAYLDKQHHCFSASGGLHMELQIAR